MIAIQKIGLAIFIISLAIFIGSLSMSNYRLTEDVLASTITKTEHLELIKPAVANMLDEEYTSKFSFIRDFNVAFNAINEQFKANQEWDKVIYDNYTFPIVKNASVGFLTENLGILFLISFVFTCLGGLLYILPTIKTLGLPGIKNNGIYHNAATNRGWIGIIIGTGLIVFYIFLYKFPEYITNWVLLLDPLSYALSGSPATQWFLYGTMYTLVMMVMGVRMFIKYRHNKYQMIRTGSVVFFQLSLAFILPNLMSKLSMPSMDLKNMWPLDYTFFFDYRINEFISAGTLGYWMFGWGIALFLIGVPVLVYFYGKRWYCSWVCGCGGLAETLGDPYRQLSDKSLKAWKIERYLVHGVLVFVVLMTTAVLYTFFTGENKFIGIDSYKIRENYGFLIGFIFSGAVGTGFYPFMGNRVWCRFGCPLAAYLGLVQRFKSRFRITTNGGQCISCGNCSTYCEMGIDVRWYAQRGENIVRSSCVGCGVCAAVCPRGVLKLENADPSNRLAPYIRPEDL